MSNKLILIVEDEYDIASTLELAFSMEDYEVKIASGGHEALETLKIGPMPDIIISDIMMPIMNGYELIQKVRDIKRYDHIPILLMSAGRISPEKLDNVAYSGYIRKPFDLDEVLTLVAKHLSK
jgi:CheY-like chemotaxis protein